MKIKIDYAKCKNCQAFVCIDVCAQAVFKLQKNKPTIVDLNSCTQCGICADLCQRKAIVIKK